MKPGKIRVDMTVHATTDKWAAKKETLNELSAAQASADIELVEAQRRFHDAQRALNAAQAGKTSAEKRLANFRANLGAE